MDGPPSRSHPLRPYVVAPSPEDWLAAGDTVFGGGHASTSSAPARPNMASTGVLASGKARSARVNNVYGLPGDAVDAYPGSMMSDPNASTGLADGFSRLLSAGVLSYASVACVMPFEVAKTLLQVQWIPKADVELLNEEEDLDVDEAVLRQHQQEQRGITPDPIEELADEEEAQAYFQDLTEGNHFSWRNGDEAPPSRRRPYRRRTGRTDQSSDADATNGQHSSDRQDTLAPHIVVTAPPTTHRDQAGYIVRRSIFDQETKPDWILPFTVTGGVWDMMKAMGSWKVEGWLSLWKGQLTTFVMETLSSAVQPIVFSILATGLLRNAQFSTLPLVHMPHPVKPFLVTVASHVVTSAFLSPLDLVRTRLICQSSQPRHRKYSGPFDALRRVRDEEGGILNGLYAHPNIILPALLDGLVKSTFTIGLPLLIERSLHISQDTNRILYGLAELGLSTLTLAFTLPVETVRRRLQLQSRAAVVGHLQGVKTYKPAVETRPKPYYGIVEAVYRILTEETSRLHLYSPEQKPRRPSMSSRRPSLNSRRPTAAGLASSRQSSSKAGPDAQASTNMSRTQSSALDTSDDLASADTAHPVNMTASQELRLREGDAGTAQRPPQTSEMPLFAGVTQLYRGFTMGLTANLIVFVLGLVAGRDEASSGWTEM